MVNDAIMVLTGKSTIGEAWKAIFPDTLTDASKIAIKVPLACAASPCYPHWATAKAICDGLKAMVINGKSFTGAITFFDGNCGADISRFTGYGYALVYRSWLIIS